MCFAGTDAGIGACIEMSLCLRFCHRFLKHETFRAGGQSRPPLRIRCVFAALFRVYLKTPNAPGQRAFLRCAASFFLEIRQYSCEKMSCATQKSLAAGHIMSFQIHPSVGEKAKNHVYYHRHPETFMLGCQIKSRNLEGQLYDGQQIRSRVFHVSGQTRKNRGNQ